MNKLLENEQTTAAINRMPYQTSRASSFRRIRGATKRRRTVAAKTVRSIVRRSLQVNHELKSIDTTITLNNFGSGVGKVYINPVIQGTTGTTRTGRNIVIDHIELKFMVTVPINPAASVPDGDAYRFHVIQDNECIGTTYATGDLWQSAATIGYQKNMDNKARFKILYDSGVKSINPTVVAAVNGNQYVGHTVTVRGANMAHYYNAGNAGTVADCEKGALFFVCGSFQGYASFSGVARVYFRDV